MTHCPTPILHLLITLYLAFALPSAATLIDHRIDTSSLGATLDGTISPNEYGPANSYTFSGGGAGFGGQFGQATLHMNSDPTSLYIGFSNLGVPTDANQYLIYFNTRPGGLQPNGLDMDDSTDDGRANLTRMTRDGTETVTFQDGSSSGAPDFALLFNNRPSPDGFAALFELRPAGQLHELISHENAGLGTTTVEFKLPLAALGLPGGGAVDFAAFNISGTGWLSNEGFPNPNLPSNPGFSENTTLVFSNFHRFTTFQAGPQIGLTGRVPNLTINLPPTPPPEALGSFILEDAFPLNFDTPMCIRTPPGETNRLFVAERAGRIRVITNLANPNLTTFLDISTVVDQAGEGGLLGFDFHPGYTTNRFLYVNYAITTSTPLGNGFHIRLSRFQTSLSNPNFVDPNTEQVLITQFHRANNHNGGDLHFGPDGYLYLATGDEGQSNDNFNNGQRIDGGFFASIPRLASDKLPGTPPPTPPPAINGPATNYAIPPDNPFIGATSFNGAPVNPANVRTEIYAIGLRNPWRIAFDPLQGDLYAADVGQGAREEINLIIPGGNYGWKWREGAIPTPTVIGSPPPGFTNWIDPILDYTHGTSTNQGRSITGGVIYRGDRIPSLQGHYLFADYISGHLWALTHNGTNATSFPRLTGLANPIAFGTDPRNGDVLVARLANAPLRRLVQSQGGTGFPPTLAETGIFHDLPTLTPFAGILPYDINLPFWSDHAEKRRWFSIPNTNLLIQTHPQQPWTFPTGTVWIKHFDLELVRGDPSSTRRLETRILVKNDTGDSGYGLTYRWGASTNNATLVPSEGLNETFLITHGSTIITQVWRYPSRNECLTCHQTPAGFALGFDTPQLNRHFLYNHTPTNQLTALSHANYFTQPIENPHLLRAHAPPTDTLSSLEIRSRAYLHVNCSYCHLPGGSAPGNFDARWFTSLPDTGFIDGPLNNPGNDPANRLILRGDVPRSMIHTRIATLDGSRMPPLASSILDTQNIALVAAWIATEATLYQTYPEWQIAQFGSTNTLDSFPLDDPDQDGNINRLEYLTRTNPQDPLDAWTPLITQTNNTPQLTFLQPARIGLQIQTTTNLIQNHWTPWPHPANAPAYYAADQWIHVDLPTDTLENEIHYRFRLYQP